MSPGETADGLRANIDRGREKAARPDPALASLGTDDEAGGTPPAAAAVAQAHSDETRHAAPESEAPAIGDAWILIAFILLFALIVVVWGLTSPLERFAQ